MDRDQGTDDREALRLEAVGAFAHEIRTPLTSIRMVLELGRRQTTDGGLVLDAELAAMLASSVDQLERLADDLQETSRLERGRLTLSNGPCHLGRAIEAARELLAPGIRIEGHLPQVEGPWDAARMARAISGFAEATNRLGDGAGTVQLAWRQHPAGIELRFSSGQAGGLPLPMRADAGFGYFRARAVVEALGGAVAPGRSERHLELTVTLPLSGKRESERVESLRILVAEDEETISQLVTQVLTAMGHQVAAVASCTDAIERIRDDGFDLVLLDLHLADGDGYRVMEALDLDASECPRVVVMTGERDAGDDPRATRAAGILQKPFNLTDLEKTVRRFSR